MFLSKLNTLLHNNINNKSSLIFSETYGDLQKITALYLFVIYQKNSIIVCKDSEEASYIFNLAQTFFKIKNVFYFPDFNLEPYTTSPANKKIAIQRIDVLYSICNIKEQKLIITTALGLSFKTIPKNQLLSILLTIQVNNKISMAEIIHFLGLSGYIKKDKVIYPGEFAIRGDILDIYTSGSFPIRISFFDDIIESIKTFDPITQCSKKSLNNINITLPTETTLTKEALSNFKNNYEKVVYNTFNNESTSLDNEIEVIVNNILPASVEHYLPWLVSKTETILNYLNKPIIILCNIEWEDLIRLNNLYTNSYMVRKSNNSLTGVHNKLPLLEPKELILTKEEVNNVAKSHMGIIINCNQYPPAENIIALQSKKLDFCLPINKVNENTKVNNLINLIKNEKESKFIINLTNNNFISTVVKLLKESKIPYTKLVETTYENLLQNKEDKKVIITSIPSLVDGFCFKDYIIVCENNIFNKFQHSSKITSKRKKASKVSFLSNLKLNEPLVHVKHGVGKYIGLVTLNNLGIDHDFLALEYSGGDKLYLPVENIDLVSKYGSSSEQVCLDKLGSNSWEKRKASIKEKLQEIAYDLIKLAAVRNLKKGPQINPNPEDYEAFSNAFPYIETEDQLKAIEDIKSDFSSNTVIDRLICGDVGFGKTEVAIRAAFLAVLSNYQVAVVAPTTLLVRQHYYNFLKRFKNYPFVIKQLSRFVSTKKKKEIKAELKEGKIDIIIATHALLSKDVGFKNLGLLIIDEEQNFGVIHKEKIKMLKEDIHTLSLTATPIPRTLQMALTGVKSLSIIATPPLEKLPIKTYVMPFDEITIKEAILREINRGGQVFFVAPFISDLEEIEIFLQKLNLNIKPLIVHGQMHSEQIENSMRDFQDNKYNILLSTNIIESGIDLNNVNTIIIKSAHKFGLAQLYQLRGRVGRGSIQSYAYITFSNQSELTSDAKKRLEAIQNLDYLGAGFALAEQDLDIRGAGNILGKEQSGHIKGIGIDLYNKFLAKEINKLKLKDNCTITYDNLSPNVVLPITSLISGAYINDINTRMEFYQQFANATSFSEIDLIVNELIDRFGKLPSETQNLVTLIKVKTLSKSLGIEKLTAGTIGFSIYFYENKPLNIDMLLKYIQQNSSYIKLHKDLSLFLQFKSTESNLQIKEIMSFLFTLRNLFKLDDN